MSDINTARSTRAEISFAGADITDDIKPYLRCLTYNDVESDESDDQQIKLQNRDGL